MTMYTTLPTDVNLFAPGLTGTLRWMRYRIKSRMENASREAQNRLHDEVLPALSGYVSFHARALAGRISEAERSTGLRPPKRHGTAPMRTFRGEHA